MCNVDITVILLHQDILSKLISNQSVSSEFTLLRKVLRSPVDECIVELKGQDEFPQAGLDLCARLVCAILAWRKDAECIGCASVHYCAGWNGGRSGLSMCLLRGDTSRDIFYLCWQTVGDAWKTRRARSTRKVVCGPRAGLLGETSDFFCRR